MEETEKMLFLVCFTKDKTPATSRTENVSIWRKEEEPCKSVFRTHSKMYDGAFFAKIKYFSCQLFSHKTSIVDG